MQKPVILAVSFGTSYPETRKLTIDAIENALQNEFPNYEIRRAFTSKIIKKKLKARDGIIVDDVKEALERLANEGIKDIVIQPTHIIPGIEYAMVLGTAKNARKSFESIKIGKALISSDADYDEVIQALVEETANYRAEDTAIVFMGHGSRHKANEVYPIMQEKFKSKGLNDYFMGTVEGFPEVEDVLKLIKKTSFKHIVLLPFMLVAGDHATNDMASDEEDSWKTIFENAGYHVTCVLKGCGEYKSIQNLIAKHAREAIEKQ